MKTISIITWFIVAATAQAEERIAVKTSSGRFEVTQEFQGHKDQDIGEFLEIVRFRDKAFPNVRLTGVTWPGIYDISPDEHWMIRTQKTGSGESIAILYHVEENGRVSEVLGFNDMLWKISDQTSRLKHKDLYHTGVASIAWSKDSKSLDIVLSGGNNAKSEDGIETELTYEIETNKATIKKVKSEPVNGGNDGQLR